MTCRCPSSTDFEVIEAVDAAAMPLTIFVTAYDQHAIRASKANALDYLLKPSVTKGSKLALGPRQVPAQ